MVETYFNGRANHLNRVCDKGTVRGNGFFSLRNVPWEKQLRHSEQQIMTALCVTGHYKNSSGDIGYKYFVGRKIKVELFPLTL